ncbi:ribosome recycling factor [Metallumcola ferriviriculae]|uniref:Ribosome-recycling factor n=2 Tax=Metallumcola ferriviriculae TaxID=3039180 RepID=A0AAU0UQX6_9FIRM|nr:ribosome recycling factor [Desulfitibacteraceae bacterium MK1]
MDGAIEVLKGELSTLRAGRANPALLDKIQVEYYGVPTPLNQVGNISAPEPRLLLVQPWDKSIIGEIEKAILKSDLGLNPNNDGNVIRIAIPQLTQERRQELVKFVKKKGEEAKVSVRNVRRDANEQLKKEEKNGDISEDDLRGTLDDVQETTNKHIEMIDQVVEHKEAEVMEV